MGNSCAKGAARSNPVLEPELKPKPKPDLIPNATISSQAEQKTFKWTVDGFSSLLDKGRGWTHSRVFEFMGLKWYLKLNPKDRKSNDEKEHVSLKLELTRASVKLDRVIEASFKFLIYDQSYGKHMEQLVNHSFQTASTTSGTPCMMPLETLKASGFLVNNSCTFGIEFIEVATVETNATLETLFVKNKNFINKAKVYTWEIEDYFALKDPSYSPEFELSGYRWYISMYPTSDGKHLSLFLNLKKPNDLPKDSGKLVEITLTIKCLENGKDLEGTGRIQYSDKGSGWGFDKFISLEDFKDASKGYLIKGKCCIEAEVTIVGSSKTK
ncbi:unnamed protein product [Urochloa decumbens]|uniref:MATH domain-containing protein n=1 Tax=Urochloa decumbens TaxID=240449 RepID=A0ABC9FX59_9POAL